jgi:LPXTG-site transpeptidase (sortase) family protein
MRVRIPTIGVDAPVVRLGLDRSGSLEVPSDYDDVGLWARGPRPGDPGAAVLAGHVDHRVTGPAVFYRLGELDSGDAVEVVEDSGKRTRFTVERIERHPKNQFPTLKVYGWTEKPTLRLVTCSGDFDESSGHYRDNLIVFAQRSRASG